MRRRTVLGVDLSRGAGYEGTSPVGAFPPNGYGLYDMIGNVWESTTDWYVPKHPNEVIKACCTPHNPRGPGEDESYDPCQPKIRIPRKVIKGGSHLCAPNYCRRYRPPRASLSQAIHRPVISDSAASCAASGMGEVNGARDTRLHRDVALKILPRPLLDPSPVRPRPRWPRRTGH